MVLNAGQGCTLLGVEQVSALCLQYLSLPGIVKCLSRGRVEQAYCGCSECRFGLCQAVDTRPADALVIGWESQAWQTSSATAAYSARSETAVYRFTECREQAAFPTSPDFREGSLFLHFEDMVLS